MLVDNIQQLDNFGSRSIFLYPVLRDERLHHKHNKIVSFILIDVDSKETWTIGNGHPDSIYNSDSLNFLNQSVVYCYNRPAFLYADLDTTNYIDVQTQYYLYTNQPYAPSTPKIVSHYNKIYKDCYRVGELIGLQKHEEIAHQILEESWVKVKQPGLDFYQKYIIEGLYNIEKNGLHIDKPLFTSRFGKTISTNDDYCYTQYNPYTITGRPSNRFGGINFAALNKEDRTREAFTSRYSDGCLLELDFSSYHPRLIAQIIGYDFGTDNVYEHLASYYCNTANPTQAQIEEAKEGTFRQLYGGIQQRYLSIPFFGRTNDMAAYLWSVAEDRGYVESPISGRKLFLSNYQDMNMYVLFNYFIQMYETETNAIIINKLSKLLENHPIKMALYTYDSILFDLPMSEVDNMINNIIPQAIDIKKFPIKIKKGINYQDMSF